MRLAVISDIHGNLEALEKVVLDIQKQQVDSVISLGDNIGYGADSELVIQKIRKNGIVSILGNHELAVNDLKVRQWFRKDARKALQQVLDTLSGDSRDFIHGLKLNLRMDNCLFVHGFPPDSARFYLFQISDSQLRRTFHDMQESICFVGHTHKLRLIFPDGEDIHSQRLEEGTIDLDRNRKYIINAGSVGQPRDGDPNAKYMIWDTETCRLETRFVSYDVETASQKIITAGIPEKFAVWLKGVSS